MRNKWLLILCERTETIVVDWTQVERPAAGLEAGRTVCSRARQLLPCWAWYRHCRLVSTECKLWYDSTSMFSFASFNSCFQGIWLSLILPRFFTLFLGKNCGGVAHDFFVIFVTQPKGNSEQYTIHSLVSSFLCLPLDSCSHEKGHRSLYSWSVPFCARYFW